MQPLIDKMVWDYDLRKRVKKPMPWKWSYSKLEQWITCRYKMYREHVLLDVVKGKSDPFAIGSGVHDALEQMVIDNAIGMLRDTAHYVNIYRTSCFNNDDLANPSKVDDFQWMIGNYMSKSTNMPVPLKRETPIKQGRNISHYWTEFFGTLNWEDKYYGDKIELTVKGDVLTDKYENVDWKTGSGAYKPDVLSNPFAPKALQLTLYAFWTYLEFGIIAPAKWILLRKDCKKITPYEFTPTLEIFEGLDQHMNFHNAQFIQALYDSSQMYRTGNGSTDPQCRWCNYKKMCR